MQERAVIRATVFTTFLITHLKTGIIFLQTKYIPNMNDLLFLGQENPYILFTVTDESLLDVAIKFSVPPTVIIYDNDLTCEIRRGMVLVVRKGRRMRFLQPDSMPTGEEERLLKAINHTENLFPFQPVWDEN